MIARIKGVLIEKRPPWLLVDVNGVGYEVEAPMSTFYNLPGINSEICLLTHLIIRDDAHLLFAFATDAERRLFRALIKVNGVGAKVALAILSGISAEDFSLCIQSGDISSLTRIPGIGKKTAERLIVEMRDKLLPGNLTGDASSHPLKAGVRAETAVDQAQAALISLGYKPSDALRMVKTVSEDGASTEDLIRRALRGAVG